MRLLGAVRPHYCWRTTHADDPDQIHQLHPQLHSDDGGSYNFASSPVAEKWLRDTGWNEINNSIEVVEDFRYLGAHLRTRATARSPALMNRWDKTLQQLQRLKICPATAEMKARATVAKIYAGAFYGI